MTESKKKNRPTIQAIAERAGVSRATVSLILTNRPEVVSRFKDETVERVRAIAKEIGYTANLMAISLRSNHPSFYGLILRGRGVGDDRAWHHQALEGQFLAGAMESSRVRDLYPVLASQDSPDAEGAVNRVRGLLDGGVFGAILRTPVRELEEPMRRQIDKGLPVVVVFPENPSTSPSNSIDVDNRGVGRLAAELLRDAGRKRWAVIGGNSWWEPNRLRDEGAMTVAAQAGVKLEVFELPSDLTEAQIREWLVPRVRDFKPDGIYTASSIVGFAALQACFEVGFRVPEDTCLVGCDASFWRAPGFPVITSVDTSWYEAGDLAVRSMVDLQKQEEAIFANILLSPQVHPGGTCPVDPSHPVLADV